MSLGQRSEKDPYMYNAPGGQSLYGGGMPTAIASNLGMNSGMPQGFSMHQMSRAPQQSSQFVPRAATTPTYANMGMPQMGGSIPSSSTRGLFPMPARTMPSNSMLQNTSMLQAPVSMKQSRPSTLPTAVGSSVSNKGFAIGQNTTIMSPLGMGNIGVGPGLVETRGMVELNDLQAIGSRTKDMASSNILPYRTTSGYGQVMKPPETPQEFQIDHEDFPALPGTSNNAKISESGEQGTEKRLPMNTLSSIILPEVKTGIGYDLAPGGSKDRPAATPIGPPKGMTKKPQQPIDSIAVPPGMVQDQFGMMGLLTFIRAAETDPNLVALALGSDLTTLGLNLNSPESLCHIFASPWADSPCRPQDIDYNVPHEYLIHSAIKDKLAPIQLKRYGEDLLFYLYYNNGGDLLQLLSSIELYNRDWRYHKEDKVWITRAPGVDPVNKTPNFEKGSYYFFDPHLWRKTLKEFLIEYEKLEEKPQLPSTIGGHHSAAVPQSQ